MDLSVKQKFDRYPDVIRAKLMQIREGIFEAAAKDKVGEITETLKWGEPSYLAKGGSTVRIDWNPKFPNQICVYFHCQTMLVDTFRIMYKDVFTFEGKRAIVLPISKELPMEELKCCISLALRYHKIKKTLLLKIKDNVT